MNNPVDTSFDSYFLDTTVGVISQGVSSENETNITFESKSSKKVVKIIYRYIWLIKTLGFLISVFFLFFVLPASEDTLLFIVLILAHAQPIPFSIFNKSAFKGNIGFTIQKRWTLDEYICYATNNGKYVIKIIDPKDPQNISELINELPANPHDCFDHLYNKSFGYISSNEYYRNVKDSRLKRSLANGVNFSFYQNVFGLLPTIFDNDIAFPVLSIAVVIPISILSVNEASKSNNIVAFLFSIVFTMVLFALAFGFIIFHKNNVKGNQAIITKVIEKLLKKT